MKPNEKSNSRGAVARLAVLLLAAAVMAPALAQPYPTRPIRLVLGAPPGGAADAFARIVAPALAETLGQQVVIDNRPGANNNISTELVARAQPDGYTLLWAFSPALTINPSLYRNLPFDPQKDFAPIALFGSLQFIFVVHSSVQAKTLQDLVALIKSSKPGTFPYASAGLGSPNHLAAEFFRRGAGVELVHVPFKGGGPAMVSVLGGETKLYFASLASAVPHIKSGRIRAYAVTGPQRSQELPDIPTMQESGYPGFDVRAWHGLVAPAGTPRPIITQLHGAVVKVLAIRDVREALRREGLEQQVGTPEEFTAFIKRETVLWAKVIREAGIKPE